MDFTNLFADYPLITIFAIAIFAFVAGFIDAVVGGGGLIQLPALLINLPNTPLTTLLGTGKIAGLSGTSVAAYQYSKKVKFDYFLLGFIAIVSFLFSFLGSKAVSLLDVNTLKPLVLVILIVVAVYTFLKKDLGSAATKTLSLQKQLLFGGLIGLVVGFYDGFFGPGTGSFLVLGFVMLLGFEFVKASAYSKVINCVTNISSLSVFISQGNYLLEIAILMAVFNMSGSVLGSKLALSKGNGFVRIIFLIIVTIMILRYGYDIFM